MSKWILVLFVLALPAFACLWRTETNLDGRPVDINDFDPQTYLATMRREEGAEYWERQLSSLGTTDTLEKRNDKAVALAHLGRCPEALTILQAMEKEAAGRYETAANLGTVHELLGHDEDGLRWIKEAMKRNSESHFGTEWVHVRILEAKLALRKDPGWLGSHTVLGYDFGSGASPALPAELRNEEEQKRVQRAIEYQLGERLPLVPVPDPVVADLLVTLGNLRSLSTSVERGQILLRFSLKYGPVQADLVKRRLVRFSEILSHPKTSPWPKAGVAVTTLVAFFLWLGRRRRVFQ